MKDEPGLTYEPEYTSILLGLGENGLKLKDEPGLTSEPEYTSILLGLGEDRLKLKGGAWINF